MNIVVIRHCAEYLARHLSRYLGDTRGVAAMEYAIIVGIIVVGVGAAVSLFQDEIVGVITDATADAKGVRTAVTNANT